jgi:hypothetical protein
VRARREEVRPSISRVTATPPLSAAVECGKVGSVADLVHRFPALRDVVRHYGSGNYVTVAFGSDRVLHSLLQSERGPAHRRGGPGVFVTVSAEATAGIEPAMKVLQTSAFQLSPPLQANRL